MSIAVSRVLNSVGTENFRAKIGEECLICLDELTHAVMTPCGHIFHASCIHGALTASSKCSICREDLPMFEGAMLVASGALLTKVHA